MSLYSSHCRWLIGDHTGSQWLVRPHPPKCASFTLFWLFLPETVSPHLRRGLSCLFLGCSTHLNIPQCLGIPGGRWGGHPVPGVQWPYFHNARSTWRQYLSRYFALLLGLGLQKFKILLHEVKPPPHTQCEFSCHSEPSGEWLGISSLALSGSHPVLRLFGHTGIMS